MRRGIVVVLFFCVYSQALFRRMPLFPPAQGATPKPSSPKKETPRKQPDSPKVPLVLPAVPLKITVQHQQDNSVERKEHASPQISPKLTTPQAIIDELDLIVAAQRDMISSLALLYWYPQRPIGNILHAIKVKRDYLLGKYAGLYRKIEGFSLQFQAHKKAWIKFFEIRLENRFTVAENKNFEGIGPGFLNAPVESMVQKINYDKLLLQRYKLKQQPRSQEQKELKA